MKLNKEYNGESIKVEYLLNPSHLGGVGDLLVAAYQKYFDEETVKDYDLVEMLKDASEKVATRKLLLVAHSQGNFYANNFYDTVAGKDGGVPVESIGVYSVATPSGRVAGEGRWITSDTDKVIANLAARAPFRGIMEPNAHIELKSGDDSFGHSFSGVYLKYKSNIIVPDIEASLARLKTSDSQDGLESCISPPKLTAAHKLSGAALALADPVAGAGRDAIVYTVSVAYRGGTFAANVVIKAAKMTERAAATAVAAVYSAVKSLAGGSGGGSPANGGAASVALALNQISAIQSQVPGSVAERDNTVSIQNDQIELLAPESVDASPPSSSEKSVLESDSGPEIIFIGPPLPVFGIKGRGGKGSTPKMQEDAGNMVSLDLAVHEQETALSSPVITVSQCDFSLATDGCLLATTTVHFAWSFVDGADYYQMDDNGIISTTTDTAFDVSAPDFSDYTFKVSAISTATTSATSMKTISVATIPIAINEIAWMGTVASTNDEWLELKNNTGHALDLSQWALTAADDAPYIALSGVMEPREYRILERREGTIIADAAIDAYGNGASKWALGNGGEELFLSYASTTLDSTPSISGGAWAAGYNSTTTRKSMERYSSREPGADSGNWSSNFWFMKNGEDYGGNAIDGTPGERNSASYLINKGQIIAEDLTLTARDGYLISTSTIVAASSTLSIEEGTIIKFLNPESDYGNAELKILGRLIVRGESENPVVFEAFAGEQTGRIHFAGGNDATSTIEFARIENIEGVTLVGGSRVEVNGAQLIENNFGFDADGGSFLSLNDTNFASTTHEAVAAYGESVVIIASTTVDGIYDGDGIAAYDSSAVIENSTVLNVSEGDGIAIYDGSANISGSTIGNISEGNGIAAYNSTIAISDSIVRNIYFDDALGLYSASSTVTNTAIQNGGENGIMVYGGNASITGGSVSGFLNGIGVGVLSTEEPVAISGAEVSENSIGMYADSAESVSISSDVSVHDNESEDIVID